MIEAQIEGPAPLPSSRQSAEVLAAVQAHPDGAWMFKLWLELLAHAGRDDDLRRLATEFWRENRGLLARLVERRFAEQGTEPPLPPDVLATALIAMDIGLAVQHHVDPDAVPLSVYPEVFGVLFDGLYTS